MSPLRRLLGRNRPDEALLADIRACRTTNSFNRLHLDFERDLAPLRLALLGHMKRKDLPPPTVDWLATIRAVSPALFIRPQRFVPKPLIDPALTLYSDPRGNRAGKHLLVAFTGIGGRLLLPVPVVLQAFDSRAWDIATVRMHPARRLYRDGIEGIAADFPGVLDHLNKVLRPETYGATATFGVSGGGYAAVLAAFGLKAGRCVCVSGVVPRLESGDIAPLQPPVASPPFPAISYVFAAEGRDRLSALAMQETFGGTPEPLAGLSRHNVLLPLAQRGAFEPLIHTLLPPPPTGRGIGALLRGLVPGRP